MTQYLILPDEQSALDRSHRAHVSDTIQKIGKAASTWSDLAPEFVTQYRWATDVGADGQTALVIDGDEQLLTSEETALLITDLPDDVDGDNWYEPPPDMTVSPTTPPVNEDVPHAYQQSTKLFCTMGNWIDPPPDTYAYQWKRDGANVGIGAAEYYLVSTDTGKTFICIVTATNAIGSTPIASNEVVAVAAS